MSRKLNGRKQNNLLSKHFADEVETPAKFSKRGFSFKREKGFGRYPEIFIGLTLIAVGIVFSFFFSGSTPQEGVDILVLTEEIQKDEVLRSNQLASVKVKAEDSIQLLSSSQLEAVVGKKALINLSARAPVLLGYFSSSPNIPAQHVLAGLRLRVGEYPTANLRAGDFVDVVSASEEFASLSQIEVYSVVSLNEGEGADFFITLTVPEVLEQAFVSLVKAGDVRLFINPVL